MAIMALSLVWLAIAGAVAWLGGTEYSSRMRRLPWRQRPFEYWALELIMLPYSLLIILIGAGGF